MEFKLLHKVTFNTNKGAFSKVTDREVYDSQITLTDTESALVIEHFGIENINIGAVKNNPSLSSKSFLLYPTRTPINLNVVFPKKNKKELRLYLSKRAGFKPNIGEVIFFFKTQDNLLCIGSMHESRWINYGLTDNSDTDYQNEIFQTPFHSRDKDVIKKAESIISTKYIRDPKLALDRFNLSKFQCEFNNKHKTFISQSSNNPFVEAHHFIPMKFQGEYNFSLDNINNIISLCPTCHRGIHLATIDYKHEIIEKLYSLRPELHKTFSFDKVLELYNCIEIPTSASKKA